MDNRVLVDSDFCNMIAPGNNIAKEKVFVKSIFDLLGKVPVIHTFVYNEELLTNGAIKELVEEKVHQNNRIRCFSDGRLAQDTIR